MPLPNNYKKGLESVVAGETSICSIGEFDNELSYRGYKIEDLSKSSCFEEISYLLIYGKLPTTNQLQAYQKEIQMLRTIPDSLIKTIKLIPANTNPIDVLKVTTSMLGVLEPESTDNDQYKVATRLLAIYPLILAYWYNFHKGVEFDFSNPQGNIATYFLRSLIHKEPDAIYQEFLNVMLILAAEHEFNASTFSARVITATLSDIYSAVGGALGALKGSLHGGANTEAAKFTQQFSTVNEAETAVKKLLKEKQKIMGFGHRVYKEYDPRSKVFKEWARKLTKKTDKQNTFFIAEHIEKVMWDEKKIFANADFYSSLALKFSNIPEEMLTAIIVLGRTAGWIAHIIEQRKDNRLIRPRAYYIGPRLSEYISISER